MVGVPAKLRTAWELARDTVTGFGDDRGGLLAAALAFHTLLSVAPLLILAVAVAGLVLGREAAREEVSRVLHGVMTDAAAGAVEGWVEEAGRSGRLASAVGIFLLLLAASRLFEALREAMNQMMNVDPYMSEGFRAVARSYVLRRLASFAMVLASGLVVLVVFASRAALTALHERLFEGSAGSGILVQVTQVLLSLVMVAALAAAVIRLVPDTNVGWRSAWVGGALTSVLFNAGNALVALYLGRATVTATYGAAGSAVVVLLWVNFSAMVLLLGAEFTQTYAARFGSGLRPDEAREVEDAQREGERRAAEDAARGRRPRTRGLPRGRRRGAKRPGQSAPA